MEYTGLCVFGFSISLLMIVRAISHHQTGNINHNRCLWLGHEPMARALCLAIFWWHKIVYISYGMCALLWRHIRGMATHQDNLLNSRFVTKKAPLICCSFVKGTPPVPVMWKAFPYHEVIMVGAITSTQVMVYHWWIPCETLVHTGSR